MAHASHKKFGAGQQDQGKGDGSGGMSPAEAEILPDNEILSNRDTARHSEQRGLDSRHVQTQQNHEHVASHTPGAGEAGNADKDKLADERPDDGTGGDGTGGNDTGGNDTGEGLADGAAGP